MAKRTTRRKLSAPLNELSHAILSLLKAEFVESARGSDDLHNGYVGPGLDQLQRRFLESGAATRVDYDLALKELEDRQLVDTGPKEMYDNPPNSGIAIFAFISKREHIYLTEDGYKAARDRPGQRAQPARQHVHISGGHFYQSPIGVGGQVSQTVTFDVSDDGDAVKYLTEILRKVGKPVDDATKTELATMVSSARAGNMTAAKPIFQRVFGAVEEPVKQVAYGIISAILSNQMGM